MREEETAHDTTLDGADNSRGYLLIYRDWYELPDEPDPLRRNAIVSTLNPDAFHAHDGAQLVKRSFEILEPLDAIPFSFTICECRPVRDPFETLEEAESYLRQHGVKHPHIGFNHVG